MSVDPASNGNGPARILVVDDDASVRALVPKMLANNGYHVAVAASAEEALSAARADPPDLFILDVMMPGMDGFALCEALVADEALGDRPILFLSGRSGSQDQVRGLNLGAWGYLTKPFNAAELLSRVKSCLRYRDSPGSGERLAEIEEQLEIAARIQRHLVPAEPPEIPGLDLCGRMRPLGRVGGDFYDFVVREEDALICIGDVSGKGIPASLVMVMAATFLNQGHEQPLDPPLAMLALNRLLHQNTGPGIFMSMVMLRWDPQARTMTFTGAGHEHMLVYRADEDGIRGVDILKTGGQVLGLREHNPGALREEPLTLVTGDAILLYSDGVTEAMDQLGEEYGRLRLHQCFSDAYMGTAEQIVAAVLADINRFSQGAPQRDDITVVVVKVTD